MGDNQGNGQQVKRQPISWTDGTLILIAILVVVSIGFGISKDGYLGNLADKEVARGLITFLIAVTAVGIAGILFMFTILSKDCDGGDKRFDRGMQVLSVLIGILGTIVGFYYGSAKESKGAGQTTTGGQKQRAFAIAPARLSNPQPKNGEKITISSFIIGGNPPYTYSLTFDSTIPNTVQDKASADGVIKEEVNIPANLTTDKDINFLIKAKDSDGETVDSNKNGDQKIVVKAK